MERKHIIPAQPGFALLVQDGETWELRWYGAILAWELDDIEDAIPYTQHGRASRGWNGGVYQDTYILHPDGSVVGSDFFRYGTMAEANAPEACAERKADWARAMEIVSKRKANREHATEKAA